MSDQLLTRRVEKILPSREELENLISKKKIRLYQGFDPTGFRLHLGHAVGLKKLMEFANAGHEVIFVFGTGTVLVGDPSQRDTGRKLITEKEINENIKDWKNQARAIVDFDKVKIKKNGDWLTKLKLKDIINIASNISAVQLFKRDSFQRRIDRGDTVWYHETMYPLLQGYDSVHMDVDLEIGGTDQEFNMLVGRELQKKMNDREKYVLTTPMIMGTDGNQMSKTSGNCIWLGDTPKDMYGKLMSIRDEQIVSYMDLVSNMSTQRVSEVKSGLSSGSINPIDAKKELALAITSEIHGDDKAKKAQNHFETTFQKAEPEYKETWTLKSGATITDMVADYTGSKSKAKRLIAQGGVDINESTVKDPTTKLEGGEKIKVGKKNFVTVTEK